MFKFYLVLYFLTVILQPEARIAQFKLHTFVSSINQQIFLHQIFKFFYSSKVLFFMYDILQLNDMLVPELHDIAEHLSIQNAKQLDKQDLIYRILDKQALSASFCQPMAQTAYEKPKRKRTSKSKHRQFY